MGICGTDDVTVTLQELQCHIQSFSAQVTAVALPHAGQDVQHMTALLSI